MSKPPAPTHTHLPRSVAIPLSVCVGAATVVQSRINGHLGSLLSDGLEAAWVSFGVGLLVVVLIFCFSSTLRSTLPTLRSGLRKDSNGKSAIRPWQLLGGIGGATFVAAQSQTVQYLGVAVFTVSIVAAQNSSAIVVDRLGLGPAGVQFFTARRVIAAAIATLGVVIAVYPKIGITSFSITALAFALTAGALIAIQQAINGRVAVTAGSPWTAGLTNFVVGWLALTLALTIEHVVNGKPLHAIPAPWVHPELWIGGLIGIAFIVGAAMAVPTLGVLLFALLSIAGQVGGALLVDLVFPEPQAPITWWIVAGTAVTAGGVAVATLSKRRQQPDESQLAESSK